MDFSFITRRPLWQNILIGIFISLSIVAIFLLMLNIITNHGEYLTVPEVKGKDYKAIQAELEQKGFDVYVQDSIYVDTLPPNIIIKQFPEPEATVKVNRAIYLTVNCAVPPTVNMPNLVGMSIRNAILELKSLGLKLGDTTTAPDVAKNAVKDQLINGIPIKPGSPIRMGTFIDLIVGAGVAGEEITVPDLFGLSYLEAKVVLEVNGLQTGIVSLEDNLVDTAQGFIVWQNPMPFDANTKPNVIHAGQAMDLKLSANKPEKRPDTATLNLNK